MDVIVYTTPTCAWCGRVKDYLKEKKIAFKEINVAQDQQAALAMVRKSGQLSVPQLEINGKIIVGFDPKAIDEALR